MVHSSVPVTDRSSHAAQYVTAQGTCPADMGLAGRPAGPHRGLVVGLVGVVPLQAGGGHRAVNPKPPGQAFPIAARAF